MKIVEKGYKMDLHIHSSYSKIKDGNKVSYNTIDNIEKLVEKLNEQEVQICAITDHDAFGYDLYDALRKREGTGSIVKVFPGIEFSVEFQGDTEPAVVHVIAIFEDSDEDKIKNISKCLEDAGGKTAYDRHQAFSEEKFLEILRKIDLDTILIAHQKNTLTSTKPRKTDANMVGEQKFEEFVHTDYFEAFEFRNKRYEVFNKAYLFEKNLNEDIRFVTGSDCHDWRFYPKETETDTTDFQYTYVKCLPTFRGLVMAMTDYKRIKTINSFYNSAATYLPEILLEIDNEKVRIPLSRGINVIIGDNSVGKSLMLHSLTNYTKKNTKLLKTATINGYKGYLKENKIKMLTIIEDFDVLGFDMQGEVRDKFEQGKIDMDEFLKPYYPAKLSAQQHRTAVVNELERVYNYLQEKFDIEDMKKRLGRFEIPDLDEVTIESVTFVGNVSRDRKTVEALEKISEDINTIVEKINGLKRNSMFDDEDIKDFDNIINLLHQKAEKYEQRKIRKISENDRVGVFQQVIKDFKIKYKATVSDSQKTVSAYQEAMNIAVSSIVDLKHAKEMCKKPEILLEERKIDPLVNKVYEYEFVSRLSITNISKEYINGLWKGVLKRDCKKDIFDMTKVELAVELPYYEGDVNAVLNELKKRINEKLDEDFSQKYSIIQGGMDKTRELSAGFNAKVYFDLLSYETERNGIYIIDQPEDNISQHAIREYLLDRFKVMGEHRQVIIVTHNPQFIVNLDVDNVIYLGKEKGKFIVQSGALEYKDDSYNMLEIVSTHIEGGLDTLKRRWKRYEKGNSFSE